jgi:hypothetical protein
MRDGATMLIQYIPPVVALVSRKQICRYRRKFPGKYRYRGTLEPSDRFIRRRKGKEQTSLSHGATLVVNHIDFGLRVGRLDNVSKSIQNGAKRLRNKVIAIFRTPQIGGYVPAVFGRIDNNYHRCQSVIGATGRRVCEEITERATLPPVPPSSGLPFGRVSRGSLHRSMRTWSPPIRALERWALLGTNGLPRPTAISSQPRGAKGLQL